MTDMASSAVGGRIVSCNDEFFAEAAKLLSPDPPVWKEHEFTDRGKWMDGWETRRRREPGFDWCIIELGIPGIVEKVSIDTAHFTGNYAEEFSLEGCGVGREEHLDEAEWFEIIPRTGLQGDNLATFDVTPRFRATHLRLNIFPDGGVARLQIDGTPIPGMAFVCPRDADVDLASQLVGGATVDASDAHYSPPSNMLRHTDPQGMWDGWETKRRRGPGFDWVVFDLGLPGEVNQFVVDTRHFKGNSPGWVSVHVNNGDRWSEVVTRDPVGAHELNVITLSEPVPASQVKLEIHPDGGVARFRVMGRPESDAAGRKRVEYLNSLHPSDARRFFHTACAARAWIETMTSARPFGTPEQVIAAGGAAFDRLEEGDWLEAFAGHPRIGERGDEVANSEQSAAAGASPKVLKSMTEANQAYEEKFGFTYIVYATGKSAEDMLALALTRSKNSREKEIENGSIEQRKISETRMRMLLCQPATS